MWIQASLRDCFRELRRCQSRAHWETQQTGSIITGDIWISSKLPQVSANKRWAIKCRTCYFHTIQHNCLDCLPAAVPVRFHSINARGLELIRSGSVLWRNILSNSDAARLCVACGGRFVWMWIERCLTGKKTVAWFWWWWWASIGHWLHFLTFPVNSCIMQLMQQLWNLATVTFKPFLLPGLSCCCLGCIFFIFALAFNCWFLWLSLKTRRLIWKSSVEHSYQKMFSCLSQTMCVTCGAWVQIMRKHSCS